MNISIEKTGVLCDCASDARDLSREHLKNTIQYFFELKKNGDIDEAQFTSLVSLALNNYLDNELILNIQKFMNDKWYRFLDEL